MSSVVSISQGRALVSRRAQALLGPSPTVTLQPDAGAGACSLRLARAEGDLWLGLVDERSPFAERTRLGCLCAFVVYDAGETPVVCGDAEVRARGRSAQVLAGTQAHAPEVERALRELVDQQPFATGDWLVVDVRLTRVQVDDGEAPVHGAIPRT